MRFLAVIAAVLLLSLLTPSLWPGRSASPWFPAAGIAVALGIWLGSRAAMLLLPAGMIAALRSWALSDANSLTMIQALGEGFYEGTWQAILVAATVEVYRRLFLGDVDLDEPRSASCFLLAAMLVGVVGAVARSGPVWLAGPGFSLPRDAAAYALAHLLGIVTLAPPLLVLATPRLVRSGLLGSQVCCPGQHGAAARLVAGGVRLHSLSRGDRLEIASLASLTTILSVLLTVAQGPREPGGWQLWGAPLLLVVWSAVRQGLPGATLTAGGSASVSLLVLTVRGEPLPCQLQGNLLAECAAALLVAASIDWVRASEHRYRQVVSQIPVVLYSTRVRPSSPGEQRPRADILFVNPTAEVIFGCPAVELLGDHDRWMQRVHPDDREILQAALMQLARQDQPVICEYRLAPRVGSGPGSHVLSSSSVPVQRICWVRDVMVPQRNAQGALEGWEGMAGDITEQRILADDLRRTTNMLHTLVANLPAGVFFVSAKSGRPILVNQRARHLLGQREDTSAGLTHLAQVYRLHRPDGSPYPTQELPVCQALQRGMASFRDDLVVHRPDGRKVPLISWAAPVDLGPGDRSGAAVWVLEDLTELRQAEAARCETEGRLRTIIESLAEGLLVQDRHGTVIDCNPAGRSLLASLLEGTEKLPDAGWLREDGSPLPPEEHPLRRVLRSGTPVRSVVLGLPRPPLGDTELGVREEQCGELAARAIHCEQRASTRWLLLNALPLAPRAGASPAGAITTLVDVTEHIQAEHLIRSSEKRYRQLVDSLPLMLIQFDRQLNVTLANPALTRMTGYAPRDIRPANIWQKLVTAEDLPALMQAFGEALAGRGARMETRYQAKDGQERNCLVLLQPVWSVAEPLHGQSASGANEQSSQTPVQVTGVTALIIDLTHERWLEQELQRSQRLEFVGRLSSGIAHDFNNLLTALLGLTHLAELKVAADHPVREELKHIEEVGEQAAHLARQILSFGKQQPVPLRRIEINRATGRIVEIFRTLLPATIQLEFVLHDSDLFVMADEIQWQQVVMNLCLNARDSMPGGGQLAVRIADVDRCEQGVEDSQFSTRWACLSVEDSGEGMTEEVRQRIFEPFYSTKVRGSGLGLSVVQQILTSFGGHVEVTSEPGRGSRFDIWLPLEDR